MKLYHKHPDQLANLREFRAFMADNSGLAFFLPSPIAAPWHVQAYIGNYLINFWPHKMTAQVENEKSVQGRRAMQDAVDSVNDDNFGVIEDF